MDHITRCPGPHILTFWSCLSHVFSPYFWLSSLNMVMYLISTRKSCMEMTSTTSPLSKTRMNLLRMPLHVRLLKRKRPRAARSSCPCPQEPTAVCFDASCIDQPTQTVYYHHLLRSQEYWGAKLTMGHLTCVLNSYFYSRHEYWTSKALPLRPLGSSKVRKQAHEVRKNDVSMKTGNEIEVIGQWACTFEQELAEQNEELT